MKKIVIVEDDQIVANTYSNKLSVEGYQVETAGDGEAGLEVISRFRPDAVILDLMLPKLSGVELLKQVRAVPAFAKLPILVFSNTYLSHMVQEAWKAGATKCLSKSACSPQQLLETIRRALGTNGALPKAAPCAPAASAEINAANSQGPAPPASSPSASKAEAESHAALRKSFLASLPDTLSALRTLHKSLIRVDPESERVQQVGEMYRRVHSLAAQAGLTGLVLIAQTGAAFEALLKELSDKPKNINASTLCTLASGIDFLDLLFKHSAMPDKPEPPSPRILVVDDEALSRRAITRSLEQAKLKSVSLEDPQKAYHLLCEQPFDLILLDVDMPGMNGFELCAKLRKLPSHQKTPVVFVTRLNDFQSRANSSIVGGNDFIAKPFLFMELAVKALICVRRRQIELAN